MFGSAACSREAEQRQSSEPLEQTLCDSPAPALTSPSLLVLDAASAGLTQHWDRPPATKGAKKLMIILSIKGCFLRKAQKRLFQL